jgi:heptosyltransferase-2
MSAHLLNDAPTVLLVRPDGIGDEILSLPVATALRRLRPKARIAFLSSEAAAPVLAHHPDLDEVITLSGRERFGELVSLFRRRIDVAIFLKPYRRLLLAAFAARVPLRVATGYRWYSLLANRRVYEHRSRFARHESEYNLGLLAGLGFDPGPLAPPALVLTGSERQWAECRLARLPLPRVVIHPGGLSARHWRAQQYRDLAHRLADDGYGVILSGSEAERVRFLREVEESGGLRGDLLDLRGALSLREFMAVIGAAQVVVSGSTGAAHLAAGLGVPTVSLYDSQRKTHPIRWGPLGRGILLQPDVPTCERCIHEACPYWDCLDRITVDEVAARVQQVLRRAEPIRVVRV